MSSLRLSQSNTEQQRDWVSISHTGLNDISLSKLTNVQLPPKFSEEINKLIVELSKDNTDRNKVLTELINKVLRCYTPNTRAEYLWFLQFTVVVLLLKDLPVSLYTLQGNLLTKTFNVPTTIWDANPVKIHYFASQLYDIVENDKNLIFVISQIESRSTLGFYVSICMLWKSLYRCVGEEKSIFRLYPPSNLISLTNKVRSKKLDVHFEDVLNFIILHSKIATLLFHRKLRFPEYNCYEEFFVYDIELITSLKEFLENTMLQAENMWRKDNENLNYLMLVEYLQIDISEFDTLLVQKMKN